jgi:hypothetical protein
MLVIVLSRHRLRPIIIVAMVATVLIQRVTRPASVQAPCAASCHSRPLYSLSAIPDVPLSARTITRYLYRWTLMPC